MYSFLLKLPDSEITTLFEKVFILDEHRVQLSVYGSGCNTELPARYLLVTPKSFTVNPKASYFISTDEGKTVRKTSPLAWKPDPFDDDFIIECSDE